MDKKFNKELPTEFTNQSNNTNQPVKEADKTDNKKSMKSIFNKLIKLLLKKIIYFVCDNCLTFQLRNENVCGIYCLKYQKFLLIIDPPDTNSEFSLKNSSSGNVQNEDKELDQSDCIYTIIFCRNCKNVIGRYILGTPSDKEYLIGKILLFPDKIKSILVDEFDSYTLDLNNYLEVIDQKEIEEIIQFNELNTKLSECLNEISDRMTAVGDYLEIKEFIEESNQYVETLERLARYTNFLEMDSKKDL